MNNKDNQFQIENERKLFESEFAGRLNLQRLWLEPSPLGLYTDYEHPMTNAAWVSWQARANLATPKLNEEVASGEAVAWFVEVTDTHHEAVIVDSEAADRYKAEGKPMRKLVFATPSPSNVLVEALRKIARISHCGGLAGMSEADALIEIRKATIHYFNKVETEAEAREALATYSSTDSVSISKSEYEAMKADVERMNYICDDKNIYWIHIQTEPSGWDLFHSGRAPELREAIDTARKSS